MRSQWMTGRRWQGISLALGAALLVGASVSPVAAQTPTTGWKMPNLNPFQKSGGASGSVSDQSKPLVPNALNPFKLIPGTGGSTSQSSYSRPQGPTTWQKVSGGTKKMARQTADFLNPFDDATPAPREQRMTGTNSTFNQMANPGRKPAAAKKSWWPSWGAEEDTKPRTVNEFLAQPRPND